LSQGECFFSSKKPFALNSESGTVFTTIHFLLTFRMGLKTFSSPSLSL
jgi:hypothetical protein